MYCLWTVKIGRDSSPKFAAALFIYLFIYLFAVGLYLMLECFNPNSFAISFVRFAQINRWWIGDWTNNIDAAFKVLAVRIGDLPGKCVLWRRPLSPEMNGRWCMTLETFSPHSPGHSSTYKQNADSRVRMVSATSCIKEISREYPQQ